MKPRLARPADVPEICRLVRKFAEEGLLLPRTEEQVRNNLSNFLVVTDSVRIGRAAGDSVANPRPAGERILGCVALESYGRDLAEIRSLAVDSNAQNLGLGGQLLEAALATARRRKIARVFAVTHAASFFKRHGFTATTRHELPEKIARDCNGCPKSRDCALAAVVAVVCPERVALPILPQMGRVTARV